MRFFRSLQALQLGELFHQLFYAVLLKLYCNLRVIPIAFATKDGSFAVLGMADASALLQAGLARGSFYLKFWLGDLLSACGEKAGGVVDGVACSLWFWGLCAAAVSGFWGTPSFSALVFVLV